jgi:hypothetical protein
MRGKCFLSIYRSHVWFTVLKRIIIIYRFSEPKKLTTITSGCKWTRQHYVSVGLGELSSVVIQDVIRQISRQPASTGLLYTNKLYSKILHPVTDEDTTLQTSNTRSYIILRASNTQSYITLRASNTQGYIILRTSNTRSYTCHGRVTYEVTNFHRRITHDHTRVAQQVHRYYY